MNCLVCVCVCVFFFIGIFVSDKARNFRHSNNSFDLHIQMRFSAIRQQKLTGRAVWHHAQRRSQYLSRRC